MLSLTFRLPTTSVRLDGLSAGQRSALLDAYPGFTEAECSAFEREVSTCRVYRLDSAPALSTEALTRDGQYAPQRIDSQDKFELTGVNFKARFGKDVRMGTSALGIASEHELAYPNVIENFLRVYAAHQVLHEGGVILHSAGLVFDERAYVFVGRSGAGKTTLSRKAHHDGVRVLSDDINLLLPGESGYSAFSVPFTGEFGRTVNQPATRDAYPVAGVVLLSRGDRLATRRVSMSEAVARLLVGCPFVNTGTEESSPLFDVLSDLVSCIPVLGLSCDRTDPTFDIINAVREITDSDRQVPTH